MSAWCSPSQISCPNVYVIRGGGTSGTLGRRVDRAAAWAIISAASHLARKEGFMAVARHAMPAEVASLTLEEIMQRYVGRFRDKDGDWAAFEDAKVEGWRRAQHRFIGGGGSGKHEDPNTIPPRAFTLSIMYVPPGQGNAPHTHEVEEIFFVLQGYLTVFVEDETGRRLSQRLAPWECIACPPGVIHGYQNESLEPVYFQVMLGRGRPEAMGYADDELFRRRDAHLKAG
jgi:quercetin dioxygenase-like cupin family protein